jgi:hypothetical protein
LVEARSDCAASAGACQSAMGTASCQPIPCEDLPNVCPEEAVECVGDSLQVCAINTDGCLVREDTDCSLTDGGFCNRDRNECDTDPCGGLDHRCEVARRACDGNTLQVCEPNGDGCLIQTSTDCTEAGHSCVGDPAVCSLGTPIAPRGETIHLNGNLGGDDPTYARPAEDCSAGTGDIHFYEDRAITNLTGAEQRIIVTGFWVASDGFLHSFSDPFDASMAPTGCLVGNDEHMGSTGSQIQFTMADGETVHLIPSTDEPGTTVTAYDLGIATEAP